MDRHPSILVTSGNRDDDVISGEVRVRFDHGYIPHTTSSRSP